MAIRRFTLKGMCFAVAVITLVAFCFVDVYSHCKGKPKNGEIHVFRETEENKVSQAVSQTNVKSCPDCSGTIAGYKYKVKYKVKKRYRIEKYKRWYWDVIKRTKWKDAGFKTKYTTTWDWDSTCSGGNPNCSYGKAYAFLNNLLIYFVGGYYV